MCILDINYPTRELRHISDTGKVPLQEVNIPGGTIFRTTSTEVGSLEMKDLY